MTSHLNAGIQEFIKVMAELSRGHSQLAAGASSGSHHLACRLVQVGCSLVELVLGLLEGFVGRGDLDRVHMRETRTLNDKNPTTAAFTSGKQLKFAK